MRKLKGNRVVWVVMVLQTASGMATVSQVPLDGPQQARPRSRTYVVVVWWEGFNSTYRRVCVSIILLSVGRKIS